MFSRKIINGCKIMTLQQASRRRIPKAPSALCPGGKVGAKMLLVLGGVCMGDGPFPAVQEPVAPGNLLLIRGGLTQPHCQPSIICGRIIRIADETH